MLGVIFIGLSGLWSKGIGFDSNNAYLVNSFDFNGYIFPNTHDTVSEVKKIGFFEVWERTSGSVWIGFVSIVGLGFWACRHPALAIVFGPAAGFALLNFLIGNRAIFYSGPLLWFGFGWLIITIVRFLELKLVKFNNHGLGPLAATFACLAVVWISSPTTHIQLPSFEKHIVQNFKKLKTILPMEQAIITSWWDYGYMSMFMNGKPTMHDGGYQTTPTTYFIANNLIQSSQEIAANEFKELAVGGYKGVILKRQTNKQNNEVEKLGDASGRNTVYLVLTSDISKWMWSISQIGGWNIKTGEPYRFKSMKDGYQLHYKNLKCQTVNYKNLLNCNDVKLNLSTGQFGDRFLLSGIVTTKDGRVVGQKRYSSSNWPFFIYSEIGSKIQQTMLLHQDLYYSVFHQLFYLNQADKRFFELVYDGFPSMRVFKVL